MYGWLWPVREILSIRARKLTRATCSRQTCLECTVLPRHSCRTGRKFPQMLENFPGMPLAVPCAVIPADSLSRPYAPARRQRRWLWGASLGLVAVLLALIAIAMRARRTEDDGRKLVAPHAPSTKSTKSEPLTWEALGATPVEVVEVVRGDPAAMGSRGQAPSPETAQAGGVPATAEAGVRDLADAGSSPSQALLGDPANIGGREPELVDDVDASGVAAADAASATADQNAARVDAAMPVAQAEVRCGSAMCRPGQACCNASCGICANPGEKCSQRDCSLASLSESALCGINTCNVGYVCCNPSCGICVRSGESCDSQICSNAIDYPISVTCGMSTCNVGMECCNASCGICAPPGQSCSKEPCG
jgi:hypothetical protein